MISIAICDDDKAVIDDIENRIANAHPMLSKHLQIEAYSSGGALCNALDNGKYFDLIFMDIEMENTDGIMAGQILREKYSHDVTLLIYISSHTKYHSKLFDVQPFQFIQKPVSEYEFTKKFLAAIKKIESGNEIYRYKKDRIFYQLKKREIISIESKGHNIIISCVNKEDIVFRGVFKEELKKLTNSFFVRTHIAYLANINHVKEYKGNCLLMDNDRIVPISEHRSKEVKAAFLAFAGAENEN